MTGWVLPNVLIYSMTDLIQAMELCFGFDDGTVDRPLRSFRPQVRLSTLLTWKPIAVDCLYITLSLLKMYQVRKPMTAASCEMTIFDPLTLAHSKHGFDGSLSDTQSHCAILTVYFLISVFTFYYCLPVLRELNVFLISG